MSEGQPAQAASSAPREPSHLESMAAGGFGGLLLVLVGHPLDTIKVRVQSMEVVPGKPPPYSGVIDCARKMIRQEGRWSLYKGIAAPLLGMTPCYALAFLGYSVGKDIFCDDDAFTTLKWNQIGLAGAVSTFFTTPILGPGDLLKCKLQVQGSGASLSGEPQHRNIGDVARHIWRTEGVRGLAKGSGATLARDGLAWYAYFASYEAMKYHYLKRTGEDQLPVVPSLLFGGIAGVINWTAVLPIDTIKTRFQVAPPGAYPTGLRGVARDLIAREGVRGLFRGLGAANTRAFPAAAAQFAGYEMAMRFFRWVNPGGAGLDGPVP